jgi:hypothetical protein
MTFYFDRQSAIHVLIAEIFEDKFLTNVGIPSKRIENLSLGRARVGLAELIMRKTSEDPLVYVLQKTVYSSLSKSYFN